LGVISNIGASRQARRQDRHDPAPGADGSRPRTRGRIGAVPYDVHALCFSDDAVTLETELLQAFAARRENLANPWREFFVATPEEVRDVLAEKLACRRRRSARQLTGGGERARPPE
jgi:hypothetical protein